VKTGFGRWLAAAYVLVLPVGYLSLLAVRLWPSAPSGAVLAASAVALVALSLHLRRINNLQWDRPGWLAVSWPMPPGWSTAFLHLVTGKELARAARTVLRPATAGQFS
jgi:hypothetical protein